MNGDSSDINIFENDCFSVKFIVFGIDKTKCDTPDSIYVRPRSLRVEVRGVDM